jgi:hypothetical protein
LCRLSASITPAKAGARSTAPSPSADAHRRTSSVAGESFTVGYVTNKPERYNLTSNYRSQIQYTDSITS